MVREFYSEGGIPHGRGPGSHTSPLHPPCPRFKREYVSDTNDWEGALILANDPGLQDVALSVAEAALAEMAQAPRSDQRVKAQRYIQEHCANCIVNNTLLHPNGCPLNRELRALQEVQEAERKLDMFEEGPVCLTVARVHGLHMTMKAFETLASDETAIARALQHDFTIDDLLGSLRNRRLDPLHAKELPHALATRLTCTQGNPDPFDMHEISFDTVPQKFALVDFSARNGFKGDKPSEKAYANLVTKLFNLMAGQDSNGKPSLLSPNLQTSFFEVIRTFDGGHVAEIRMASKNRLYVAVCPEPMARTDGSTEPMPLVAIIGSHGGDETTQDNFIGVVGLSRRVWR